MDELIDCIVFQYIILVLAAAGSLLVGFGVPKIQSTITCPNKLNYTICNNICFQSDRLLNNCLQNLSDIVYCGNYCTFSNFTESIELNSPTNESYSGGIAMIVIGSIILIMSVLGCARLHL